MLVGIISDTHGLLRPEAAAALRGSDAIIHAGDIGKPEVLDELRAIAPLTVIRGNVDKWAESLPDTASVELEGKTFYVIHNVRELDFDPAAAGFDAVISGHSHKPGIDEKNGVLYLNPGSAGPRRFTLPVALARIRIAAGRLEPGIVELSLQEGRRGLSQ
jgi:putative phosphoesterase